jgi:hypothetical protein
MLSAILSGLFSGIVAALVSIGIEKYGGNVGGILGSSPSTIIPAIAGLWITLGGASQQEIIDFQKSLLIICPGVVVNACFLYCWRVLPKLYEPIVHKYRNASGILLAMVATSSFLIWLFLATALVLFSQIISENIVDSSTVSVFHIISDSRINGLFYMSVISIVVHVAFGVVSCWNTVKSSKSSVKVTAWTNLLRGTAASVSIFLAVLLSNINPLIGGVATLFPAIFGTAMISVWIISGYTVSMGAIEPLILGSLSVSLYAFISAFLLPTFALLMPEIWAIIMSLLVAYLFSILFISYPCFKYLCWRRSVNVNAIDLLPPEDLPQDSCTFDLK